MIISTTPTIEGKSIKEYKVVVFGETINGIYFIKDFAASLTSFTGGRVQEYENELIDARASAMSEMINRAKKLGANAIVGVSVDLETINASMIMFQATGTAVVNRSVKYFYFFIYDNYNMI